jgi:hypothetical protein
MQNARESTEIIDSLLCNLVEEAEKHEIDDGLILNRLAIFFTIGLSRLLREHCNMDSVQVHNTIVKSIAEISDMYLSQTSLFYNRTIH